MTVCSLRNMTVHQEACEMLSNAELMLNQWTTSDCQSVKVKMPIIAMHKNAFTFLSLNNFMMCTVNRANDSRQPAVACSQVY